MSLATVTSSELAESGRSMRPQGSAEREQTRRSSTPVLRHFVHANARSVARLEDAPHTRTVSPASLDGHASLRGALRQCVIAWSLVLGNDR